MRVWPQAELGWFTLTYNEACLYILHEHCGESLRDGDFEHLLFRHANCVCVASSTATKRPRLLVQNGKRSSQQIQGTGLAALSTAGGSRRAGHGGCCHGGRHHGHGGSMATGAGRGWEMSGSLVLEQPAVGCRVQGGLTSAKPSPAPQTHIRPWRRAEPPKTSRPLLGPLYRSRPAQAAAVPGLSLQPAALGGQVSPRPSHKAACRLQAASPRAGGTPSPVRRGQGRGHGGVPGSRHRDAVSPASPRAKGLTGQQGKLQSGEAGLSGGGRAGRILNGSSLTCEDWWDPIAEPGHTPESVPALSPRR